MKVSAPAGKLPPPSGDQIRSILTNAPGNGAAIGELKVATDNGIRKATIVFPR